MTTGKTSSTTTALQRLLGGFVRDRRGATAVTAALSLAVVAPLALGVADVYVASEQKGKLQDALDAAALAAARSNGQTDAAVDAVGDKSLNSNLALIDGATLVSSDFRIVDGTKIVATAAVRMPTLGPVFSQGVINVSAEVQRAGKIEVTLVLDNTGSMAQNSKLSYLQSAAKSLVDKLVAASKVSTDPNPLKMSLVPFSSTVRVQGTTSLTSYNTANPGASGIPAFIDPKAGAHWIGGTNNDIFATQQDRFSLMKKMTQPWNGCVEARRAPYDITEDAANPQDPATMWAPYFWPDEKGSKTATTSGFYNSYLADSGSGTDIQMLRDVAKYNVTSIRTGSFSGMTYGPNAGCALQPVMPLSTNFSGIKTAIDNMTAVGETNIPLGLQWGWMTLSPTGPFATKGQSYATKDLRKIVILMTDGDNTFQKTSTAYGSLYDGLGYAFQKILTGISGASATDAQRTAAMDGRLAQLCTNMKAKKIIIYTVRVEVTTGTSTLLQNCASSPDKFYDVKNASGLGAAFDAIAASIQNLRISD